jgi:hypothetical protein
MGPKQAFFASYEASTVSQKRISVMTTQQSDAQCLGSTLSRQNAMPGCLQDGTLEQLIEDRVFGRYVVALGYSTIEQVQECLRLQGRILDRGGRKMRLPDILVARNYLTRTQMTRLQQDFEHSYLFP